MTAECEVIADCDVAADGMSAVVDGVSGDAVVRTLLSRLVMKPGSPGLLAVSDFPAAPYVPEA